MTPHAPAAPPGNRYLHRLAPTPLVPVRLDADAPVVWCKLEFLHPSGSTKDRMAQAVLAKAWRQGRLRPGDLVVEASSGSTSIAFALACAQYGLRFVAVMPEGVSGERVALIRAYGGRVHMTPRADGLPGALGEAARLAAAEGAFYPQQFANPDNAESHRVGTAREVLAQIPGGTVDLVVSGVGTGGTLVGLHRGLAECGCPVRPVLARPVDARAPGAAADAVPDAVDVECSSVAAFSSRVPGVVDGVSAIFRAHEMPDLLRVDVPADDVLATTRRLHRLGFPVGPSSGLNYRAAVVAAERHAGAGAAVVTVFPDRAERYFSTELFRGEALITG